MNPLRTRSLQTLATGCMAAVLTACGPAANPKTSPPQAHDRTNAQAHVAQPAAPTVTATSRPANYERLRGRWLRPDGGYVLEVRTVNTEGRVEAAYYNPRPIHVGAAHASQTNQATQLFVELRDVNYPGSTYTLTYYPLTDRLAGIYFQAAQGQSFDVEFVRQQ